MSCHRLYLVRLEVTQLGAAAYPYASHREDDVVGVSRGQRSSNLAKACSHWSRMCVALRQLREGEPFCNKGRDLISARVASPSGRTSGRST